MTIIFATVTYQYLVPEGKAKVQRESSKRIVCCEERMDDKEWKGVYERRVIPDWSKASNIRIKSITDKTVLGEIA